MNKVRKFFRGSGRALALIFAASVAWLLFDMAALRLSFSDVHGGVPKAEVVRRERARLRGWRERGLGRAGGEPRQAPRALGREEPRDGGGSQEEAAGAGNGLGGGEAAGRRASAAGVQSPPAQPSLPAEKPGRRAGGATHLPATKPALPRGAPAAAPERPLLKFTHSAATGQLARGAPPLAPEAGLALKVAFGEKSSLAEFKRGALPAEGTPESHQGLRAPADPPPANVTGVNARLGEVTRGLEVPVAKPAASEAAAGQRGASPGATGLGKPSKAVEPSIAHANVVPLTENQVVMVSKEGAQVVRPTTQAVPADAKGNVTHRSMEGNVQLDKLKVTINATKVASLKASMAKGSLVEGTAHKFNLADKAQLREINQSDSGIHLTEDVRRHKVLAIDRSLVPRDPKAMGQFGRPAVVPGEKKEEAKRRWNEGNFNVYLSDLIPVDRAIEDTRPRGCSDLLVHNDLPTTSIIVCFVDEVWSTLLRSVHSALNRSPPQYIKEVILVDDFSTKAYLKDPLDKYMAQFPKVRVLHLKERHGLIRARLAGAEIAKGDVLTFLDSHVECNVGWLEPLLDRIHLNRKKVACPVIEVISDKDMSYMTVDNFQRGIFTWPMNFGWKPIPTDVIEKKKIKETDIIRCPVMAGGLFSIDKKYFFELGTYDPGLDVWGGENMEISFKVWMCGGEIEIIPCSRVGHIFRNDNPYSFPKDRVATVERNLARVAEVWLDEYKDLFYGHAYHLTLKNLDIGDLSQQRELRKRLQCKSFQWYLDHIYPDLEAPLVKATGLIINIALAKCITVDKSGLAFETCDVNNKNQKFNYTWMRLIQHEDSCVAPTDAKGTLGLHPCDKGNNSLKWLHKSLVAFHPELVDHMVLEHLPGATCLEVDPSQKTLRANVCSSSNPYQKWQFGHYYAD